MKNRIRNNFHNRWWLALLLLCVSLTTTYAEENEQKAVNVQEIVFSHIQDAYTWHITEWNGKEISIPLPVIVRSQAGEWSCFPSSRLQDGQAYKGYRIANDGDYSGKIVEVTAQGETVRPLDLSLTKNACALLISSALLIGVILYTARWYRNHPMQAPKGFVGMMEMIISFIYNDVIKEGIGKENYRPFAAYLLTVFFFILTNNLLGIIPIFPGGASVTGNITITMVLAIGTFVATNLFATKQYWKDIFWPDTPIYLKLPLPIMPFVEFFGVFTKPFALMIRLFANIMAGHTIILALTSLIFITAVMGKIVNGGMTVISVGFCVFMNCMEIFVACLQAYIFTLLSANYIGMAKVKD